MFCLLGLKESEPMRLSPLHIMEAVCDVLVFGKKADHH